MEADNFYVRMKIHPLVIRGEKKKKKINFIII